MIFVNIDIANKNGKKCMIYEDMTKKIDVEEDMCVVSVSKLSFVSVIIAAFLQ